MANGWVKSHRKIINWQWYTDIPTCHLFQHLVRVANSSDGFWRGIEIKRGQRLTSLNRLSVETGLSVQQVRTALEKLKSTHELTSESTNQYTLVTLINYDFYQSSSEKSTDEQQTDNKRITNEQQTSNKRITTNKNNKKDKNDKNDKNNTLGGNDHSPVEKWFEEVWAKYPNKKGKGKVAKSHKENAYKIRDEFDRALRRYINETKGREIRFIMHGSTFFRSGYVDYLDENYVPSEGVALIEEERKKKEQKRQRAEERERRLLEEEKRKIDEEFKKKYPQYTGMTQEQIQAEIKKNLGRVKTL